jgi:hypothetical protein
MMRDAGRGDGAAAGSGNVIRDDVTVRSNRFVQRFRQLWQERPVDVPAAWQAVLALFKSTFNPPAGRLGIPGAAQPLTKLITGELAGFYEQGRDTTAAEEFMAWTEQFRHQVSEQVEKFGPTMRTMGSSVWSEPVLPAYNKGGGVSVEITVAEANRKVRVVGLERRRCGSGWRRLCETRGGETARQPDRGT